MEATKEILLALEHVRSIYPEVSIVIFNTDGRWQYMSEDFDSPIFDERIDISILEKASDSVEVLPYIYQL